MKTKARKPALTAATVDKLRSLAGYAKCEAEVLFDSPDKGQRDEAKAVTEAADWVFRLCRWHEERRDP